MLHTESLVTLPLYLLEVLTYVHATKLCRCHILRYHFKPALNHDLMMPLITSQNLTKAFERNTNQIPAASGFFYPG